MSEARESDMMGDVVNSNSEHLRGDCDIGDSETSD